ARSTPVSRPSAPSQRGTAPPSSALRGWSHRGYVAGRVEGGSARQKTKAAFVEDELIRWHIAQPIGSKRRSRERSKRLQAGRAPHQYFGRPIAPHRPQPARV